jgi:hypothetical protein
MNNENLEKPARMDAYMRESVAPVIIREPVQKNIFSSS